IPQVAQQSLIQASHQCHASGPLWADRRNGTDDHRREILKLRRPARPWSGVRLRLALAIPLAPFSQRADGAPGRARQADGLPELHQRLVEIARTAAGEEAFNGPLDGAAKLRLVDVPFERAKTS